VVGGTITVTDAGGTSYALVSQDNGNFYTSQSLTFPVSVSASACPSSATMTAKVTTGGCATSGCHVSGSQGAVMP
jgi:hypothetical protein